MPLINIEGQPVTYDYDFDPTYGYDLKSLLAIEPPDVADGFAAFWQARYQRAMNIATKPQLTDTGEHRQGFKILNLSFTSTDEITIKGWALVPESGEIKRGFVIGHGYGGCDGPDFRLPFEHSVLFFPCSRGISRSRTATLPESPPLHVIHGIEDRNRYLIGGCVDDLWLSVSALLDLFPQVAGSVGLLGISFSGGTTLLAAPWDKRVSRCHVNVPTFGHHPLRSQLRTHGSGDAVQRFANQNPGVAEKTLAYFDAATAASFSNTPTHFACARFDPCVAPPGQFATYNATPDAHRKLFVLTAGHHEYRAQQSEEKQLLHELRCFFGND